MTFVGNNVFVVAKEFGVKIKAFDTYVLDKKNAFTLYDSNELHVLMNIQRDRMKFYNAWIILPGYWMGHLGETKVMKIGEAELKYPSMGTKDPQYQDIVTFAVEKYEITERPFDMLYTIARMNGMEFEELLAKYAKVW